MTPDERYARCEEVVLGFEAGYDDSALDSGGPTNMGVTLATLEAYRGYACTATDIRCLTPTEAAAIYRTRYWTHVQGDALPAGVDLIVFDAAVNCGPAQAVEMLQRALALPVDGVCGRMTLATVAEANAVGLIDKIRIERVAFYRSCRGYVTFGRGWLRRVESVARTATKWATPPKPSLVSRVLAIVTPPPTPTLAPLFAEPVSPIALVPPEQLIAPVEPPPIAPARAEAPTAAPAVMESLMSWFTSKIEHPAIAALAALMNNPAITANPAAAQAVATAQSTATEIASTTTAAAHTVAAEATAAADPIVADFEKALQAAVDGVLTSTLGPAGGMAAAGANTLLALIESKGHGYLATLFGSAKSTLAAKAS